MMSHLKNNEIEHLRTVLEERRRALNAEIRELVQASGQEHHKDLAGAVSDEGDESVANMLTDIGSAIADRHLQELRLIEAARERVVSGDYGVCAECGGEIPYERLAASPTAARCIACQERLERASPRGGAPTL